MSVCVYVRLCIEPIVPLIYIVTSILSERVRGIRAD